MWDELRKQVAVERQQLHRLVATYRQLFEQCAAKPPTDFELSALAAAIHSFYTGIENIFKRIAESVDGQLPSGESWHKQLLDAMTQATRQRRPVVSHKFRARLMEYMEFRHFFRTPTFSSCIGKG